MDAGGTQDIKMRRLHSIISERIDSVEGVRLLRLLRSHQGHRLRRHGEKTCIDVLIEEVKGLPQVLHDPPKPRVRR
jgi:hypothetical protein